MNCKGCDAPLPPNKGPGRQRIWCSEKCRKETLYGETCGDCGRRDNGSEGKRTGEYICQLCRTEREYGERNQRILDAWERGDKARVIADHEGMTEHGVLSFLDVRRRRKGEPIPRRNLSKLDTQERWARIVVLWGQGKTAREIADEFGTTPESVGWMIYIMRQRGYDLPYRQESKVAA